MCRACRQKLSSGHFLLSVPFGSPPSAPKNQKPRRKAGLYFNGGAYRSTPFHGSIARVSNFRHQSCRLLAQEDNRGLADKNCPLDTFCLASLSVRLLPLRKNRSPAERQGFFQMAERIGVEPIHESPRVRFSKPLPYRSANAPM